MIYLKDDTIVARRIDEEMILVPVRNEIGDMNSIFVLNEVGARIWELIDGVRDTKDIIEIIKDEYDAPEDAERDVLEFITNLERIGVIRAL